ncbi:MAG: transposase [Paracoccaceae bacterium]|nr:transposase [Paracoccaceae bacterium]MDG1369885.1 transposase [Paracoccaceae bacterium]
MSKARAYLNNGVLAPDNNAAEQAMKPVAIGRSNWTFSGSEGGGKAMAVAYTLIETAKMNDAPARATKSNAHHHPTRAASSPLLAHRKPPQGVHYRKWTLLNGTKAGQSGEIGRILRTGDRDSSTVTAV